MVHGVESFRKVDCHQHRAEGGFGLVESLCHPLGEWQKGGGGGVLAAEAVLGIREREVEGELGEEQALKHLDRGREEGDGTVGGPKVARFAGLGDRDDGGLFPYGRDVSD